MVSFYIYVFKYIYIQIIGTLLWQMSTRQIAKLFKKKNLVPSTVWLVMLYTWIR